MMPATPLEARCTLRDITPTMRYTLREPMPRQKVTIEHALGQFSFVDGVLHELIEIASTVSGEWTLDQVWKPHKE